MPPATSSNGPLVALAATVDAAATPLWPTLPANLTTELERTAAPPPDAAGRLRAATARLGGWELDLTSTAPAELGAQLRAALEGVALAEPLAFGTGPEALAAAGLLHRVYAALDGAGYRDWVKVAPAIGVDRKLLEVLATSAPAMRGHLAAAILRAGTPEPAVADVLRDLAERARLAGDLARSRTLYVQLVEHRGAAAQVEDWYQVGNAHVRVDDRVAAAAALGRLRALAQPGDRAAAYKASSLAADLGKLELLLTLGKTAPIEGQLERVDLLRALGRGSEAQTLVTQLKQQHPKDARVRVRFAAIGFEGLAQAGNMLEAAGYVAQELGEQDLEHRDADYWSMLIGAQGAHAMGEALPQLFSDHVAGAARMVEILTAMRTLSRELATSRPGRAAALGFVIDHAIPIIQAGSGQGAAVAALVRDGLSEAISLRAAHPESADLDRLVYTFATFSKDREAALAAVTQHPVTSADDVDLYLQRARTAVTVAIVLATPAAIDAARKTVEEVGPSWSQENEAHREALLGDCDALAATGGDSAAWQRARAHYEKALSIHKAVRGRVLSNLGWIDHVLGDDARAEARFHQAAEEPSDRRWVPLLATLAEPQYAAARLDGLRSLVLASGGDKAPATLLTWIAALSPDPKEAGQAAQKVLDELAEPFSAIKPSRGDLGFETEGAFQVGIGLSSRKFYELNTVAYGSLWLMPKLPLDRAQLEAKARAIKPTPAAPKRPKR